MDTRNPQTVSKTDARQGETSGHVRYMLAVSIVLVIVAFAVIYFFYR
jgi:hypothetical protein